MYATELREEPHLDVRRRAMAVICFSRAAFCQIDAESMLAPKGAQEIFIGFLYQRQDD